MRQQTGYSRDLLIELFGTARGSLLATQSPYAQHLAVRAAHSRRPVVATIRPDGLVAAVRRSPTPVPIFS